MDWSLVLDELVPMRDTDQSLSGMNQPTLGNFHFVSRALQPQYKSELAFAHVQLVDVSFMFSTALECIVLVDSKSYGLTDLLFVNSLQFPRCYHAFFYIGDVVFLLNQFTQPIYSTICNSKFLL